MMPLLAILGGGQLARMTAQAAQRMGLEVGLWVRPGDDAAALQVVPRHWVGDWNDGALQARVLHEARFITLESEFVPAECVRALGERVRPGAVTVERAQDKLVQKRTLESVGIPVAQFAPVGTAADVERFAATQGWPVVIKSRTHGYDGYGNAVARTVADVENALGRLRGRGELMVEAFIPFRRELAIQVARRPGGETAVYPLVETIQRDHICHVVLAPAEGSEALRARAEELARRAAEAVESVGMLAVELFETVNGNLLVNELAPRPHNSAHYTLDGCVTSQFENHVRAVMDWPLGDPSLKVPAAVMVNLLGESPSPAEVTGLAEALAVTGASVHLYGKNPSRPGRKMGHVTAVGPDLVTATERARRAASLVHT